MNLIIVTCCPHGLATSFLAARALERAGREQGWHTTVEMHSGKAPDTPLAADDIRNADLIVAACHQLPDPERFAGKRLYQLSAADALPDPGQVLQSASQDATPFEPRQSESRETAAAADSRFAVAVTACPTGVAHTFMAAEALVGAAQAEGVRLRVETQGSVGARDELTDAEIASAEVVILACDIEVDPTRFAGKRVWRTSTGTALKKPVQTLQDAFSNATVSTPAGSTTSSGTESDSRGQAGPYKHLLTGVSFMLPMVVAGGLMIALSFVFGIKAYEDEGSLAAALMQIGGGTAFKLMIPMLAGYIAYSIADRPGLAPGMIGGYLAGTLGAGFLGGIAAGFLAGYTARLINRRLPLPESVEALKPILIIPLLASLVTGLTMVFVIGTPMAGIMAAMTGFLESMGTANAVLLGAILGAMMCFDLGGPVNKAAYTFGVGLLSQSSGGSAPMAAIMAAGMVPAIGMGVASFLARGKFAEGERQAGRASFILGLCFISEGAIPFMAKDPLRVIPVCMIGGAITGALSMYFGVSLLAPHGGLFVLLIPNAVSAALPYLLSITVGSLVIGGGYALIKTGRTQVAAA